MLWWASKCTLLNLTCVSFVARPEPFKIKRFPRRAFSNPVFVPWRTLRESRMADVSKGKKEKNSTT